MPWLSRANSVDAAARPNESALQQSTENSRGIRVSFIPAQIDGLCGTTPAHHRQVASQLLWSDMRVFVQSLNFLPAMARSVSSMANLRSCFSTRLDTRDTIIQSILALLHIWMILVAILAFVILPASLFLIFVCVCWLVTVGMAWPMTGPRVWTSGRERAPMTEDHPDERWIYINGMGCSHHALRSHCKLLSQLFGRQIIGVHNPTSGLIIDLLNAFLQRCFNFSTPSTLTLLSQIRDACLTNSVRKVILLGHSTGTLHISIALEQLHANLPVEVLSKLEIYTFGSAAAYVSNPCLRLDNPHSVISNGNLKYTRPDGSIASPVKATLASLGHRVEDHERVIPHIEHYAFASDVSARCGVIQNTRNVLGNRFCGRVFILDDMRSKKTGKGSSSIGGGFLMNQHYLNLLFGSNSRQALELLDTVVSVDIDTAEKREFTAQGFALPRKSLLDTSITNDSHRKGSEPSSNSSNSTSSTNGINGMHMTSTNSNAHTPQKSRSSSPETQALSRQTNRFSHSHSHSTSNSPQRSTSLSQGSTVPKSTRRSSWETPSQFGLGGVAKARVSARECEGRSVRQLSRLWRYMGGARPIGEGVPVVNGVGHVGSGVVGRGIEERQ